MHKTLRKALIALLALALALAMGLTVFAGGAPDPAPAVETGDTLEEAHTEEDTAPPENPGGGEDAPPEDSGDDSVADSGDEAAPPATDAPEPPQTPEVPETPDEEPLPTPEVEAEDAPAPDVAAELEPPPETEETLPDPPAPGPETEAGPETADGTPPPTAPEPAPEDDDTVAETDEEPPAKAASFGLRLDATSTIVGTYDELKQALSGDNGLSTIYLGANITTDANGVSIHKNKAAVVIDGSLPDGGRFTLTQHRASNRSSLIRVDAAGSATTEVTLRNMDIVGNNNYGVVSVADSLKNVTITLENIHYTGPQPLYHLYGTACFIGGSYTLAAVTGIAQGELAEALHVELGGELAISAPGTTNAILWLVNTASTLTVLSGANVSIPDAGYLIYGSVASVSFQPGAHLSLTASRFGFSYGLDSIGTFTLGEGAGLTLNLDTREVYAALRVSRRFEMQPGSSATILRTGAAGIPLRLTTAGAQAVFTQPRRVFFYSSAGVPLRFTGAGSLSITTSALNIWAQAQWPLPGGTATLPSHIWNRAGDGLLTVSGTYLEAANQTLTHNLADGDPITTALNADTFNLEKNQLLAFGAATLSLDIPTSQSPALTGGAAAGAQLLAGYTLAGGAAGQSTGDADAAGRYSLPVAGGSLQAGSAVSILAGQDGLFARQTATVQDAGQYKLSFEAVPGAISFGTLPVPGTQSLVGRGQPLALSVSDTRPNPTPWRIDAHLSAPLTATVDGAPHQLPGALVFKTAQGDVQPLTAAPLTVHRQANAATGTAEVQWGNAEGILLNLAPGAVYSGAAYTATIHWSLIDAP